MNASHPHLRRLLAALAFIVPLCTLWAIALAAPAEPKIGMGYVDEVRYLVGERQLIISGWAAPEKPNVFTSNVIVRLGGKEIYRGRMERSERPDVVASTGRPDWLWSGLRVRIGLPGGIDAGHHTVSAAVHLGDGTEFELAIAPAAQEVNVAARPPTPSLLARSALALAILAPLLAFLPLPGLGPGKLKGAAGTGSKRFGAAVLLSFALLVAAGWTGSSLGLLLDQRGIASHDERPWLGEPRPVRSDEWEVITPLAISQAAHQPPFPRINLNLGTDGQNMLVVGMTGVPVAHISALAKPATWGFFVFDLRRALAWYWWFPFFACFGAIWLLLQRFFELDWRLAAGLALTIAAAPYSVAFSGWPAYALFFPVAGLLATESALRAQRWQRALAPGVLLGLAIAGFALVLYPAWQISLAYLLLPFGLAWFASRRKELFIGRAQLASLILALAIASLLMSSWWLDARDAIASVRATLYPGQRSIEVGGDIDRWYLVKGLMSPISMYRDSSLMAGASDAASVVFFVLPITAAVVLRWIARQSLDAISAVLFGYVAIVLYFMFLGFPPAMAKLTFWGSTTSYRLDLALGMAQLLVLAWLASPMKSAEGDARPAGRTIAVSIAALAAIHAAYLIYLVPPPILETIPPSFVLLSLAALAGGGYLLLRAQYVRFLFVYGALMLMAALPFNPVGVAPSAIAPAPGLAQSVGDSKSKEGDRRGVVILGERDWAMVLPAAGLPVVNSVFYYPQESLWRRLDPEGKLSVVYNRYQRVLFVAASMESGQTYRIDSPRLDEVRVSLDPARFDFRLTGGQSVLAGAADAAALRANPTLKLARSTAEWALFSLMP